MKFLKQAATLAVLAVANGAAFAQSASTTFDPSSSVTAINGTIPGMLAVGGAVFLVALAIKSTKWARRAL